jgi:hypothetical protein
MMRISKDLADQMVLDVLISISKSTSVPTEFSKNSLDIMNDPIDNSVLTGVLITKAKPSLLNDRENDMKFTIMSSLQSIYCFSKEEPIDCFEFNSDLSKEFCHIDNDKCLNSTKLNFALNQFVNAFYEYERLEKKYPELMKVM